MVYVPDFDDFGPDFEGFAKAIIRSWPCGDVDAFYLYAAAVEFGLVRPADGGFNPEIHSDANGYPEVGDQWFVLAYDVSDGEGK